MKLLATVLLLGLAAPSPELRYFRYERPVETAPQSSGQTCVILTPAIFSHAASQLSDLRLYNGGSETPYVILRSAPVASSHQVIAPLNLGRRAGQTVFDLAMPAGRYRDVELAITGHDFIATVKQHQGMISHGSYGVIFLASHPLG